MVTVDIYLIVGTSHSVHIGGICLEHRVAVPPEAAHFSLKMTVLGELHCVVLPWESLGLRILHVYVMFNV